MEHQSSQKSIIALGPWLETAAGRYVLEWEQSRLDALTADIFGLPTGRSSRTHESSGLGAAIDAAVGLGLHASFEAAVGNMVHIDTVIEPDPERQRLYDQLYRRVYKKMYARLKPLYEDIMAITGYPPS